METTETPIIPVHRAGPAVRQQDLFAPHEED